MPAVIAPDDDAILSAAISGLTAILPFDAVQLLRHEPRRDQIDEVLRIGYEADAAWALQHLFTQKYRFGFTNTLSPNDGLPPAISSVRSEFRNDFIESRIFRDYLGAGGFRDGMSMELFVGNRYVGIAHFSARAEIGFADEARRAAAGVRGMLAALVLDADQLPARIQAERSPSLTMNSMAAPTWYTCATTARGSVLGPAPIPTFLGSASFHAHLVQFRESGLASIRYLWEAGGEFVRIEIRAIEASGELAIGVAAAPPESYGRLSAQELRVLSLVCAGYDDALIAARLQLSRRTVESHVLNARRKLGARNRVEAVVRMLTTASFLPDPSLCRIDEVLNLAL